MYRVRHATAQLVLLTLWISAASQGVLGAIPLNGSVLKRVIRTGQDEENHLRAGSWVPWQDGFERQQAEFVCDNGTNASGQRGASQTVTLDQRVPEPIVASAWSRAEGVTGSADSNYSLYLDLMYADGTHLWGQNAPFEAGTHGWQERRVVVVPEKPVRQVSMHLLLRGHAGKAWFRNPRLCVLPTPAGAARFDGVAVAPQQFGASGFQVRDVAADSDYLAIGKSVLGLKLNVAEERVDDTTFFDVTLTDTTGRDRAITLLYAVSMDAAGLRWLEDPRRIVPVEPRHEYVHAARFSRVGSNGRLSRYPLGAVANDVQGVALGMDMTRPAFFRIGYNAGTRELFLAYDLGLTPEKPSARIRFCRFSFPAGQRFRGALSQYYAIFPQQFRRRVAHQGLWMPFAKISQVKGWQDFGFRFKEGNNETQWDDAHGIVTFRYTEPMTWWMRMPPDVPRTQEAALKYARMLAEEKRSDQARSLLTSGYHDSAGRLVALLRDTPWCDGAVWSMNSMPGVPGEVTDFGLKWNATIRDRYYGSARQGDLDGEYIDSSEGYVTGELDFRRDHFAAAGTPLCFSTDTHQPAIFRGLIAFEYVRRIAQDVHAMDKLMMANSTPIRLCWLTPMLDVCGTETNWHAGGRWRPMSDPDLLYRRALCKGKPFCFLMNTQFEEFSHALVEKYMKRCLAYGMFPGFFSHNASQGHYFTRPELYDRDRPLFRKYVPLCRLVSEAGWQPLTGATCSDEHVYVERFGEKYLTVFNDSGQRREATVRLQQPAPATSRELVSGRKLTWHGGTVSLMLEAEDVAVIELR